MTMRIWLVLLALLAPASLSAQALNLMPMVQQPFLNAAGTAPLGLGRLYTYAVGTTSDKATYSDALGSAQNVNPVVLSATGRANVFLQRSCYHFVLKTSAGVTVWDADNICDPLTFSPSSATCSTVGGALYYTVAGIVCDARFKYDAANNKLYAAAIVMTGGSSGTFTQTVAATAGTVVFQWPATSGSPDQVMTTNGAGVGSWGTPAVSGVTSITGTGSQVIASAATGAVTLSLPQSIATTSTPTFGGLTVTSGGSSTVIAGASIKTGSDIVLNFGTPTCAGSGCSFSAGSQNSAFRFAVTTTGSASVVVTFGTAFSRIPVCMAVDESIGQIMVAIPTTANVTITGPTISGDTIGAMCVGF